jgi:hypothetical protein
MEHSSRQDTESINRGLEDTLCVIRGHSVGHAPGHADDPSGGTTGPPGSLGVLPAAEGARNFVVNLDHAKRPLAGVVCARDPGVGEQPEDLALVPAHAAGKVPGFPLGVGPTPRCTSSWGPRRRAARPRPG